MLSKDAATNFAKTKLSSTIVKGTVPSDAFGSTALASQISVLDAAGEDSFTHNFVDVYGLNTDMLVIEQLQTLFMGIWGSGDEMRPEIDTYYNPSYGYTALGGY